MQECKNSRKQPVLGLYFGKGLNIAKEGRTKRLQLLCFQCLHTAFLMYIQLLHILTLSHISTYILNSSLFNIVFYFKKFSSFFHVLSRFFSSRFYIKLQFLEYLICFSTFQIFYFVFQFCLRDFTLCAYSVYQTVLGIFRQLVSRHLITTKDIRRCCKITL